MDTRESNMTGVLIRKHAERQWHTEETACWDTARRLLSKVQDRALRSNQPYWCLGFKLLTSTTVRNNCLLFKFPSLWCFVMATCFAVHPLYVWDFKLCGGGSHIKSQAANWYHSQFAWKKCSSGFSVTFTMSFVSPCEAQDFPDPRG